MNLAPEQVVIVGASVAGVTCADRLRMYGFSGQITLVERESQLPYDKPPLSKQLLVGAQDAPDIMLRSADHFENQHIKLLRGQAAEGVDTDRRVLQTNKGELAYDVLVVASGVRPAVPAGTELVPTLRTLEDARSLKNRWRQKSSVVVIGGGFLGLELAASARTLGLHVDLVEPQPLPLAAPLGAEKGSLVAQVHRRAGTNLRLGRSVISIRRGPQWSVELDDGSVLVTDDVVMSAGTTANTEWLAGSPLAGGAGVRCDVGGRTAVPGVFAIGDIAEVTSRYLGETLRVEHWTNALEMADAAAHTITHPDDELRSLPVPYFWSHQFEHRFQMIGRSRSGDDCVTYSRPGRRADEASLTVYVRRDEVVGALAHNWPTVLAHARRRLQPGIDPRTYVESILSVVSH